MKKFLFAILLAGLFSINAIAQMSGVTMDDVYFELPENCVLSEELSSPDEGAYCFVTPDKDFMVIFMYFMYDESFSARDRLIGEADQMGIELTGDGDIATMNLGEGKLLEFTMTSNMGIGVSFFYPEEKTGVYVCIITQEPDDERMWKTMTSMRAIDAQE